MANIDKQNLAVIKIGSFIVTDGKRPKFENIREISNQIAFLKRAGLVEPVLVSSGAIGTGMAELCLDTRPKAVRDQQATAAIGQPHLVVAYNKFLRKHGMHAGQVLLKQDDFRDLTNTKRCIYTLLELNAIPILNANDPTDVAELQHGKVFSDNDTLSSLIAVALKAKVLLILTQENTSGLGSGGAETKMKAVLHASDNGVKAIIAQFKKGIITRAFEKGDVGTVYNPPTK